MWYRGIIGSFIGGINEIYDFFSFPSGDMVKTKSNFKQKFSFQNSKMKIFKKK
jgi:hypothetical protein